MGIFIFIFISINFFLVGNAGMKQTDGAPPELAEIIHPHWAQFPPQHPMISHFFGVMFFVLWVMSVVGNGLVIFIFLK